MSEAVRRHLMPGMRTDTRMIVSDLGVDGPARGLPDPGQTAADPRPLFLRPSLCDRAADEKARTFSHGVSG